MLQSNSSSSRVSLPLLLQLLYDAQDAIFGVLPHPPPICIVRFPHSRLQFSVPAIFGHLDKADGCLSRHRVGRRGDRVDGIGEHQALLAQQCGLGDAVPGVQRDGKVED